MREPVLFLDDGGVISDNSVRAPQWQQLVGEFFAPKLGGTLEEWAVANRAHTDALFAPGAWKARLEKYNDYWSFQRDYSLDWMRGMCNAMGIEEPGEEESIRLTAEATRWITPQVNAGYEGAADAIRLLHARGHVLYTASGEASGELEGYLGAMGVRHCFQRLYGTDLVDTPPKSGSVYFERMFADSGVSPGEALVVDDSRMVLGWAMSLGARGVLVTRRQDVQHDGFVAVIGSLAELPAVLEALDLAGRVSDR